MKTILVVLATALAVLFVTSIPQAEAADVYKAGLFWDGGANNGVSASVTIDPKTTYAVKCSQGEACYKVGAVGATATVTPDCAFDYRVSTNTVREFNAAGSLRVAARSLDGGQAACNLYTVTSSP